MGMIIGWFCRDCGAGEEFYFGSGMNAFDDGPSVVERSKEGSYGPAMKKLFGDGIPEGWAVFKERVFYRCSNCDEAIGGIAVKIDDGSGCGLLIFYLKPEKCDRCGETYDFWSDMLPMSEDELLDRCQRHVDDGCSSCGSSNVQLLVGRWD